MTIDELFEKTKSTQHYTIKELADAKGTSAPVRAALLALEARVLDLEDALGIAETKIKYLDGGARVGRFRICLPYGDAPDKIAIYDGPEGGDFDAAELEALIAKFYEERF